ncbi:flavoprotein [Xylariaceae sp. FL0594]|nr:flavoprotein [Xylariaceae sp. FL0594]
MLQAISDQHDAHHTRTRRTTLDSLATSFGDGKVHILLAASGSVATIKLPNIIQALSKHPSSRLSIRVVLTSSAAKFLGGQSHEQPNLSQLNALPNVDAVYVDTDEWKEPWVRGRGILHIELRRWADILVIAPLSANTMARIVNGFADNLLTSVVRAWDPLGDLDPAQVLGNRRPKKRRIIVAPAMNTAMWRHPITAKQLRVLEEEWGVKTIAAPSTSEVDVQTDGRPASQTIDDQEGDGWFEVLRPASKVLACGDTGDGAMIEWTQIVAVIEERLGLLDEARRESINEE